MTATPAVSKRDLKVFVAVSSWLFCLVVLAIAFLGPMVGLPDLKTDFQKSIVSACQYVFSAVSFAAVATWLFNVVKPPG